MGVLWECLFTPRIPKLSSDMMWGKFEQGGKVVRMTFRANSAPKLPVSLCMEGE